jgi:flagellin-like hook-associated protein FlgL
MADITLSTGIRNNLLALNNTKDLIGRTQGRLATGLSVSSPIDDAVKYFQAKSLGDRASDLGVRKSGIEQGVSTLTTAADAMKSIESLLNNMKGTIDAARSASQDQRKEYGSQIKTLAKQIGKLVNDSTYKGLNLLNATSSTLTVTFSEKSDSKLQVNGVNFTIGSHLFLDDTGAAIAVGNSAEDIISMMGFATTTLSAYKLSNASALALFNSNADKAISYLEKTISNVQAKAATMGANIAILNVRLDFTKTYINTLQGGADKLTVADLNSEGANLVALQTRQQMGVQSLSFAGQMEQSVLKLLG